MNQSKLLDSVDKEKVTELKKWIKESSVRMTKLVEKADKEGKSLADLMGFGQEHLDQLYLQAQQRCDSGMYEEGAQDFRSLMLLNPKDPAYPFGLAASLHRQKEYARAALIYSMACTLSPCRPETHFHLADCYLRLDNQQMAIHYFKEAIRLSGDEEKYAILKAKSIYTLKVLEDLKKDEKVVETTEAEKND